MSGLTHLSARGEAHMVDVSDKAETTRVAVAQGAVTMKPETLAAALAGDAKKGDVLGAARLAGIMAAKPIQPTMETMQRWLDDLARGVGDDNRVVIDAVLHEAVPDVTLKPVEARAGD